MLKDIWEKHYGKLCYYCSWDKFTINVLQVVFLIFTVGKCASILIIGLLYIYVLYTYHRLTIFVVHAVFWIFSMVKCLIILIVMGLLSMC